MTTKQIQNAVLLLVDALPISHDAAVMKKRLESNFGFTVQAEPVESFKPIQLKEKDLVVICSQRASSELREAPIPIIACHPKVLFELGMTLAMSSIDFGYTQGKTVQVNDTVFGHPLTAGLEGVRVISGSAVEQGWARPGSNAIVAATLPDNAAKAVAFGYEQGDPMPALIAVHRRVGFLIGFDHQAKLETDGWKFFDAAVQWAIYNGGLIRQSIERKTATSSSGAASPTKVLSTDEYRDWVQENVARGVLIKLSTILSVIGIAGLVAIITLGLNFITSSIDKKTGSIDKKITAMEEKLKNKIDEKIKVVSNDLEKEVNDEMEGQVAKTLLNTGQILAQLQKEADKIVSNLLDSEKIETLVKEAFEKVESEKIASLVKKAFEQEDLRKYLVEAAAREIGETDIIDDILTKRFRPILQDENEQFDIHQRIQALRLILVFGTDAEKLREDLMVLIKDQERADYDLKEIALNSYRPSKDFSQDKGDLDDILNMLMLKSFKTPTESFRESAVNCIARFPDGHAQQLHDFLKQKKIRPNISIVLAGLVKMQGDKPVVALGEMIDDKSWGIRKLGWQGLTIIDSQRKIGTTTRQAVLEKLWKVLRDRKLERSISDDKRLPRRLQQHAAKLYQAAKNNDLASIEVLQLEAFNYPFTRLDEIYQDILLKSKWVSRRKLREISSENSAEMLKLVKKHKLRPPALVNLLRPNDWEIVKKWIEDVTPELLETKDEKSKSPDGSDKIYKQKRDDLDMILASWVRRLKMAERYAKIQPSEIEKPDPDTLRFLFNNATELDDFLYRAGSADTINYAMQYAMEKKELELQRYLASKFLDRFAGAYRDQDPNEERFSGFRAISQAVKIDAKAEQPFTATLNLLYGLELKDVAYWKLVEELANNITKKNANPSIRQVLYQVVQQIPPDLANYSAVHASIRSLKLFIEDDEQAESVDQLMLTLQSLTGIKDARTSLDDDEAKKINYRKRRIVNDIMNLFRNYYVSTKQKDLILRKLNTGIKSLQGEDLSYVRSRLTDVLAKKYLAYGKTLFERNEMAEAQQIFQKAIDLDPDNPQFFTARADMWDGLGKYDQAVADLDQAILNGGKGRKIYLVHKLLGLKLLKDDHQATEKIMQTAVKLAKTNREKAGAMENIGLFYLKKQQWEQSFKNSDEVNEVYDKMSWNWLIRAIAAKRLDNKAEEETTAISNWCNIGKTSGSLQSLKEYVPHEVEYYDEHSILKLESACTGNQSGS